MKSLDFKRDILPFVIATIGELVGLFFWLRFLDDRRPVAWAIAVMSAGFLVEKISVFAWLASAYGTQGQSNFKRFTFLQSVTGVLALSVSEIIIWFLWLAVVERSGFWIGGFAFAILIHLLHSIEMALAKNTKLLAFVPNRNTIFFSIMEIVGAMGWLYYVRNEQPLLGSLFLIVGITVEHVIQGASLKPETQQVSAKIRA